MHKIIFVFSLALVSTFATAQKSQVVSAWNYMNNGELDKARTAINTATNDAVTSIMAKTWYYRGNIYLAIYSDTTRPHDFTALEETYNSYIKAKDLDTKGEYSIDMMNPLLTVSYYYFNEAVIPYNERKYQVAYDRFSRVSSIYKLVNTAYGQNIIDTSASFYTANCAVKLGKFDEAKTIYSELTTKNFNDPEIYVNLADIAAQQLDTSKAIAELDKGLEKFPAESSLRIKQLNLYIFSHRFGEAIEKLKAAIVKEPARADLYQVLGSAYENTIDNRKVSVGDTREKVISIFGQPLNTTSTKTTGGTSELFFYKNININISDKGVVDYVSDSRESSAANYLLALQSYEKAILLNPSDFISNYSLGALIYNAAVEKIKVMNELPTSEQKKYDKLKLESDSMLQKCLPYLEKARIIKPNDLETYNALKELYTRMDMLDKLKELNSKKEDASANLDKVKVGMSFDEVINLLGQPDSISKTSTQQGTTRMLFYDKITININEEGKVDYINQ